MPHCLPLWSCSDPDRPIAWRDGQPVPMSAFAQQVATLAASLPKNGAMLDLCEDRYRFLVAYAAALSRDHTVLLPPSRAERVVAEVESSRPGSYRCDDAHVEAALRSTRPAHHAPSLTIPAEHVCMIGFTSGSTSHPKAYPKLWRSVNGSNGCNAAAIRAALNIAADETAWIVATVPPQHMYGMELSVLLPLIGGMAVHAGRPLFPLDVARALGEVPEPRVLVSTPVHLRTIVESDVAFPRAALIVSSTAPLDSSLAARVEKKLDGELLEVFGSTETCVLARRRTAAQDSWQLYEGVELTPQNDGTLVNAPWFAAPVTLQDIVELRGGNRFVVCGRNTDMIEVAGKRASLADLTRRMLAIEGVLDAVVFQPEAKAAGLIRRVAALVVAPGLNARTILERLAPSVDPAFLPRPLIVVDALPRNELGKLPRDLLAEALRRG